MHIFESAIEHNSSNKCSFRFPSDLISKNVFLYHTRVKTIICLSKLFIMHKLELINTVFFLNSITSHKNINWRVLSLEECFQLKSAFTWRVLSVMLQIFRMYCRRFSSMWLKISITIGKEDRFWECT